MKRKRIKKSTEKSPDRPIVTRSGTVLELLSRAVGAFYSKDPSRAGVVVSHLSGDSAGEWYVSIVRYQGPNGSDKRVQTSARAPSLAEAIMSLADAWKAEVEPSMDLIRELARTKDASK